MVSEGQSRGNQVFFCYFIWQDIQARPRARSRARISQSTPLVYPTDCLSTLSLPKASAIYQTLSSSLEVPRRSLRNSLARTSLLAWRTLSRFIYSKLTHHSDLSSNVIPWGALSRAPWIWQLPGTSPRVTLLWHSAQFEIIHLFV